MKICSNCRLPKPLKMFVVKRCGVWAYIERCKPCRAASKPFRKFWKPLTPEQRERNRMASRARKLNCSVIIPFTKREIIFRDGLNCYLCGKLLTEKTATIDHVKPLSRGGFHCPNNAKIACKPCNQKKTNKELSECCDEFNQKTNIA